MTVLQTACHLNVLVAGLDDPGFEPALGALARLGYGAVVLPPVDAAAVDRPGLRAVFADHGLVPIPIAGQAADANIASPDAGVRSRGAAALRAMVELAADLGGDQLNGVPYGLFGPPGAATSADALDRAARELGAIADEAADRGVLVTFEVLNRYESSAFNTAAQALAFAEAAGSENLRLHLDTFHMAIEECDAARAVASAVPRLGYLELGQSGRGPLGAGSADVRGILDAAVRSGYRGRIGVEAFSRSVLSPAAADQLAIWREPYTDGAQLAAEAAALIGDVIADR